MKRCPTCRRTYADDGFTFCLEDGALLSAPYDPDGPQSPKTKNPVSTIRSSGPPPTAVLPGENQRSEPAPLPPTIASPGRATESPDANQFNPLLRDPADAPPKKMVRYIAIAVLVLIVGIGVVYVLVAGRAQCPKLLLRCSSDANRTECYLEKDFIGSLNQNDRPIGAALSSLRPTLGLQMPALPAGVSKVTWSVSAGKIVQQSDWLVLDTTGLEGKRITVMADISGTSWGCSDTIPSTFVVPAGLGPAK